jgi:hypothetical protein
MRLAPVLFLLAAGCTRDPTFFGYWDIYEAERGGVVQPDIGFFEIDNNATMYAFLRYTWTGAEFAPDPSPHTISGETDATAQEVFGNYKSKGETYAISLGVFGAVFDVDDYLADEAVLTAPDAVWPPGTDTAETTLYIRR